MLPMTNNYSLSDIATATGGGAGFGGGAGGWLWIIVVFALLFGWGNGGFNGGCGGYATRSDIADGFATNSIQSGVQNISTQLCNGFHEQTVATMSGDNAIQSQIANSVVSGMQNTNAITSQMASGFDSIQLALNNLQNQMASCCCDLKTQMLQDKYDDVRYQLEQSNTAVANAVQTQNILGQLGRFYTNPPYVPYGQAYYGGNTVI